jgi:hypothetical protein
MGTAISRRCSFAGQLRRKTLNARLWFEAEGRCSVEDRKMPLPPGSTLEYADICCNVKKMDPAGRYTPQAFKYSTGFINDGFWGCVYVDEDRHDVVIAFKGTGSAKVTDEKLSAATNLNLGNTTADSSTPNSTWIGDLTADLKLAIGIIPNQASSAEKLFLRAKSTWNPAQYTYSITGHSLGGYLAQVVSYWYAMPCVTFIAPGAWGDLQKAKLNLFKPLVMIETIAATFQWEDICVNFIHTFDTTGVGNYGLHRGRTFRLNGVGHGIDAIYKTISKHKRWSNCSPFDTRAGIAGLWDRF